MQASVKRGSLLTLHYRIALADGTELISTFGTNPATLRLGNGEFAPTLERLLIGLPAGVRRAFMLEPENAFGLRDPALVERRTRSELPAGAELHETALIEFEAPGGSRHMGMVRELDAESALIDFNHPLAGKAIRFEVEIVGIL
ncbi:MAG: peptidylprolyl isomerase [Rhodocyclaceae bacterium]